MAGAGLMTFTDFNLDAKQSVVEVTDNRLTLPRPAGPAHSLARPHRPAGSTLSSSSSSCCRQTNIFCSGSSRSRESRPCPTPTEQMVSDSWTGRARARAGARLRGCATTLAALLRIISDVASLFLLADVRELDLCARARPPPPPTNHKH